MVRVGWQGHGWKVCVGGSSHRSPTYHPAAAAAMGAALLYCLYSLVLSPQ